jgi:hypothetical protein
MGTPGTNFGKVTVSTGYGAGDTSIVLATGHGSRLAATALGQFPLTWWNATDYADPSDDPDREIILVTVRTGDTLDPILRGQEGTSASAKNLAGKTYKMLAGLTEAMWNELHTLALSETFRGLSLQTHPDSDVEAHKVRLVHADAIVMSDGEEVTDWDDVDGDLTASGAGGLDTGTEQASTWYEIHSLYNGILKKLMFHRAKDYFLDEVSSAGEDASQGLRSAVDNSTVRIAQGFQTTLAGPVEFIDVKLLKTGTPTGNYWFTIEADSGGVPSNTPLATSDKYKTSRLTTTANWVRIPFRTPFSVSAATQYHLVMYGDYAVSASDFASWRMDGSAGAYANGSKALFDSDTATWTTNTDDDMIFKVYVTENDTALTIPAGYRTALIGYAYNNASSNLKHFSQQDRVTFCGYDADWQIGSFGTAQGLRDLFAFVPPVPVTVDFVAYNASASSVAVGKLSSTDLVSTAATEHVGSTKANIAAGFVEGLPPIVLDPYQGILHDSSAGTTNLYVSTFDW